jgi:hypothetical protein
MESQRPERSKQSGSLKAKPGLLASARSNLLFVLVLVVSALALLTILVWGVVLLRG